MRVVNSTLLRGAVVHVDVRTIDGADASNIFIDLLTQMGAKCLCDSDDGPVTHVVFKDGARDTMRLVQESNGAVKCVGVSWVLE